MYTQGVQTIYSPFIFVCVQSRSQSMPVRGLCSGTIHNPRTGIIWERDWLVLCTQVNMMFVMLLRVCIKDISYASNHLQLINNS